MGIEKSGYLVLGVDLFFNDVIPDEYGTKVKPKFDVTQFRLVESYNDIADNHIVKLLVGPEGEKVIAGMHGAFAAYAAAGNNLIIDYILLGLTQKPNPLPIVGEGGRALARPGEG